MKRAQEVKYNIRSARSLLSISSVLSLSLFFSSVQLFFFFISYISSCHGRHMTQLYTGSLLLASDFFFLSRRPAVVASSLDSRFICAPSGRNLFSWRRKKTLGFLVNPPPSFELSFFCVCRLFIFFPSSITPGDMIKKSKKESLSIYLFWWRNIITYSLCVFCLSLGFVDGISSYRFGDFYIHFGCWRTDGWTSQLVTTFFFFFPLEKISRRPSSQHLKRRLLSPPPSGSNSLHNGAARVSGRRRTISLFHFSAAERVVSVAFPFDCCQRSAVGLSFSSSWR